MLVVCLLGRKQGVLEKLVRLQNVIFCEALGHWYGKSFLYIFQPSKINISTSSQLVCF